MVIAFLPRSKSHLISWLQSLSAVILEPPKIKSATISTVSPSISHEVMGPDAMNQNCQAFNNSYALNLLEVFKLKMDFSYICSSVSSVTQSCLTLWGPMHCSTTDLHVYHQLPEFTQTHVHWVGDAIQPSHLVSSPSPPTFNLSQHQGLFKWVSSSHQVAKVLELQFQHQSFQWMFRTDFL